MPYSLTQINEAIRTDPKGFAEECDAGYAQKGGRLAAGKSPSTGGSPM